MADTFDITNTTPTTIIGGGGIATNGYTVDFVTKPSGLAGQLRFPAAMFTPETVAEAVGKEAAKLEAIKAL